MSTWPPVVSDFKALFTRDFVYGSTLDTVQDSDITRALSEAGMVFNPALWGIDADKQNAYLYAAAHFLVIDIQGAGGLGAVSPAKGLANMGGGAIESKGVGGVSVGYALPDIVRQSPILSFFMRTGYGQFYLSILVPRLVGNIMVVSGGNDFGGLWSPGAIPNKIVYGGSGIDPLEISTPLLLGASHGVPYSQQLQATGGVSPIAWTVTGGTLPAGIAVSLLGLVSGTPSIAGTYFFTVTATDQRGATAVENYQLVVV